MNMGQVFYILLWGFTCVCMVWLLSVPFNYLRARYNRREANKEYEIKTIIARAKSSRL